MTAFFPRRRAGSQCDSIDYTDICDQRWIASQDGIFWWDERRSGYCHAHLTDGLGIPILLDACPFCKCLIPGKAQRRAWDQVLAKRDAKRKEGENPTFPQADGNGDR